MATTFQFVDSIASSPTVRLDLNTGSTWRTKFEGTDLSPPPMNRSYSSTLLSDGARIPASAYGNRTLQLSLHLSAATQDAAATALQTLHRELDRPANWIRYQPGTTAPIFFRTFRTPPQAIRILRDTGRGELDVDVPVEAEPFAYGLLVSLSPVTITDDPAAGTNRMCWDITGITGDVETPAKISWPRLSGAADRIVLFATRRRGTPTLLFVQAEAATQGTDTTTQVNVSTYSGTSNNYSRTTFATATAMTTRLTYATIGTAGVDLRGSYRVFYRYTMTGASSSQAARWLVPLFNSADPAASVTGPTTYLRSGTRCWADLGEITIPLGHDVPGGDGPSGVAVPVAPIPFRLQAQRISGSSNLDSDVLIFVPSDEQMSAIPVREHDDTTAGTWVWDGFNAEVYGANGSGQRDLTHLQSPQGDGQLLLAPNVTNRVYFLRQIQPGITSTISDTTAITVEYWPRYLFARPAST